MKKRKKKTAQQQMSPKQFIKERARNLPLHECLISLGWEESRQPVVMISRKHTNGNISSCFYVVDLLCLGVIFSRFFFNIQQEEYEKYKNTVYAGVGAEFRDPDEVPEGEFESISYTLAHNIIYAGLEYAADFDIPPHESFETTQFFIEEDNENIELVDIECGSNGKPLFIYENLTDFTNFKPEFILNKLEKNPGPGNYHFMYQAHDVEVDEGFDEDEGFNMDKDDTNSEDDYPDIGIDFENSEHIQKIKYLDYETDLSSFTEDIMQENLDKIMDFVESENENEDDDVDPVMRDKIFYLAFANAYRLCDKDLVNNYYNKYFDMADIPVSLWDIPEEVLPVAGKKETVREDVEFFLPELFFAEPENNEAIEVLREIFPDNPFVAFLHVAQMYLYNEKNEEIKKTLDAYLEKYPDYQHLKLYEMFYNGFYGNGLHGVTDEHLIMSTWFSGRKQQLHYFEFFVYALFVLLNIMHDGENEKLLALSRYVMQNDNEGEAANFLIYILPDLLTDNFTKGFDLDDEID